MSLISIRLNHALLEKIRLHAHVLHLSQTDYIRKAIEHMNEIAEPAERKDRLTRVSLAVRKESLEINSEFSAIEYDPES